MGGYDWGQGGKGAIGGALAGGSVGGPIGAGIGAGLGLLGGFGGNGGEDAYNKKLQEYYASLQGRTIQEAGPAAQAGYSGFRQNQSDLIKRLEALSSGQGPSLAAQQFQQATDRNMAGQQALAQSGRGGAMASLNAANNMGMLGAQAAQGSALARTDEEMKALNQLGLTIYGGREADEGVNKFNAGQQNNTALANLDARLRTMGMNDQARMGILQQMGQQANKPGLGDQIMAGGAGMFAMGAGQGGFGAKKMPYGGGWANGQGSMYGMPPIGPQGGSPYGYGGQGNTDAYTQWMNTQGPGMGY